ncbi:hypothetical protein SMD11_0801 [Streptomyces albireticuli]|uniref:Uncharacterized protein n=1 Tax=Streptomyces albireticuli TaxID=1940 RepID=A0A1Z2KWP4_9ACTN|nr:hypothetical protein SMD11_0801 [Streptomyces albireticuli]
MAFAAVLATAVAAPAQADSAGDGPGDTGDVRGVRVGGTFFPAGRPRPAPPAHPHGRPAAGASSPTVVIEGPPGRDRASGRRHLGSVTVTTGDGASVVIRDDPGCVTVDARAGGSAAVIGHCPAPRPRPPAVRIEPPAPRPPAPSPTPVPPERPAPPPAPAPRPVIARGGDVPPPPAPAPEPTPTPVPTPSSHIAPRAYHQSVSKRPEGGVSLVTFTLLLTAPAVLSAALLRPRGGGGRRG